jgi:hypothetical protein
MKDVRIQFLGFGDLHQISSLVRKHLQCHFRHVMARPSGCMGSV